MTGDDDVLNGYWVSDDNVPTENKDGGGTRTLSTFCPTFTFFIIPPGPCNVTYVLLCCDSVVWKYQDGSSH